MEAIATKVILIDDYYQFNSHGPFHLYSHLLRQIDHKSEVSPVFPYCYSLPTTECDMELSDDKLLEMPIFDLNIAKLPVSIVTSSLTGPVSQSDLMALAVTMND
uniref:Uncharacterized protein n=1 Tax=Romanomermis culicivorax TaxID=13658 RepID=A0A915K6M5_ROMCU